MNPVVAVMSTCDEPLTTVSTSNLVLIVVSIEEVNEFKLPVDISNNPNLPSCTTCDAEKDVFNDELNDVTLAALAENEVATDELKSPVTLATLADNAVTDATLAENEVATEPLNVLNPVVEVMSI